MMYCTSRYLGLGVTEQFINPWLRKPRAAIRFHAQIHVHSSLFPLCVHISLSPSKFTFTFQVHFSRFMPGFLHSRFLILALILRRRSSTGCSQAVSLVGRARTLTGLASPIVALPARAHDWQQLSSVAR